jgi:hypothetical protein
MDHDLLDPLDNNRVFKINYTVGYDTHESLKKGRSGAANSYRVFPEMRGLP